MEDVKLRRGDVVICVLKGDYGKPRPAVVVQSDLFTPTHASITLCPLTSHRVDAPLFRLPIAAAPENGLDRDSQIMVDKVVSVKTERVRERIGRLSSPRLDALDDALRRWLNLT